MERRGDLEFIKDGVALGGVDQPALGPCQAKSFGTRNKKHDLVESPCIQHSGTIYTNNLLGLFTIELSGSTFTNMEALS